MLQEWILDIVAEYIKLIGALRCMYRLRLCLCILRFACVQQNNVYVSVFACVTDICAEKYR